MLEEQQAIIPNSTVNPTANPNPLTDASCSIRFNSTTCGNAGGTMSETTNNVLVTIRQPEESRPFRCEVCNITCNTEDLLEKHKQGKKHLKNLQNSAGSSASAPKTVPPPVASETLVGELENKKQGLLQHGLKAAVASDTLVGELENKKQGLLQHGLKADSVHCDLCNVVCYNQDIYQKHVVGKKHTAKAVIQLASKNGFFVPTSNSSGGSQKKPNTFQCGLCQITCTSNELLKMHIAGKKHLNKLRESGRIPNLPLTPIASPMVNSESNEGKTVNSDVGNINGKRAGSFEDVELKRQKILQGGAPLNGVRTCMLCNVVCNSPTVYLAHLAGQKHAAMVMKKAEALTTGQES